MSHVSNVMLSFLCIVSLSGCDRAPSQANTTSGYEQDRAKAAAVTQDLTAMEDGVRLNAATKRIEDLERKVDRLEMTPEKLDLQLLTDRVTALEQKAAAAGSEDRSDPVPKTPSRTDRSSIGPANASNRSKPVSASDLKLQSSRTIDRLASPDETKAFTRQN